MKIGDRVIYWCGSGLPDEVGILRGFAGPEDNRRAIIQPFGLADYSFTLEVPVSQVHDLYES